ncbi:hypothetical protein ACFL5Z_13170 [Planctomycetota bacterium]
MLEYEPLPSTYEVFDYHLSSDSRIIDAGMDAGVYIDIDGDLRPLDDGFEIGVMSTRASRLVNKGPSKAAD